MVRRRAATGTQRTATGSASSTRRCCPHSTISWDGPTMLLVMVVWATVLMYWDAIELAMMGSGSQPPAVARRPVGQLRLDWSSLQPKSSTARLLTAQRRNCSLPLRFHSFGQTGLGAELHAYTFSMCLAHQHGHRLYSPHFLYHDPGACPDKAMSTLGCYFDRLELLCPEDAVVARQQQQSPSVDRFRLDYWNLWGTARQRRHVSVCHSIENRTQIDHIEMRSAAVEAIFTAGVSSVLLGEARRQHALVFPQGAPPSDQLITVHVRWGDKRREMPLVPMRSYIHAVQEIVQRHRLDPVHVFLATEDPSAVYAFRREMPPHWHLYLDQFYLDQLPFRNNRTQDVAKTLVQQQQQQHQAHTGLWALGSLLVALEANHYVLTSASNWSRLINELRRNIVRLQDCPNYPPVDCTSVTDLQKADFWMDLDPQGNGV